MIIGVLCLTHGGLIALKALLFVKVTTTLQHMRKLQHFVLKLSRKSELQERWRNRLFTREQVKGVYVKTGFR